MTEINFGLISKELEENLSTKPILSKNLSSLTSLKIGGTAKLYVIAENLNDIRTVLEIAEKKMVDKFIIGKGTNLVVSDDGYNGIVIELGKDFNKIIIDEDHVISGASVRVPFLVREAYEHSLKSLSFAVGIPGTLGGALAMNAGTNKGDIGSLVKKINIINDQGEMGSYSREDINFTYRSSDIKKLGVILEAELVLQKGNKQDIKWEMERQFKWRKESQPINYPTAGCIFKNPSNDISAGFLIEQSGCKGINIGGAMISELHANFIINKGEAKAIDIYRLINKVKKKVFEESGISLEEEIEFLGDFKENI